MPDIDLATVLADGEYLKRAGDTLVGDIPAAGGSSEDAVDAVAAALVEGAGIDIVYDDTANTITVASTVVAPPAGTTILTGVGAPTSVGTVGDFYVDTDGDDLYGPKSATAVYGPEQRIGVGGVANSDFNGEVGVVVTFLRAGRVTKIRYYRRATTTATVNVNVWNDFAGPRLAGPIADSQGAGVAGWQTVTLPTPLTVTAGQHVMFSIGAASVPLHTTVIDPVVETVDCIIKRPLSSFFSSCYTATVGNAPSISGNSAVYVEPVFEASLGTWPLALETTSRRVVTYTATATACQLSDAGCYLRFTGTNPTYTVMASTVTPFPVGTQIDGIGVATAMTLIQGAGVTITKARTLVTLGAGSGWTLIKTGTDAWDAHGDFSA